MENQSLMEHAHHQSKLIKRRVLAIFQVYKHRENHPCTGITSK